MIVYMSDHEWLSFGRQAGCVPGVVWYGCQDPLHNVTDMFYVTLSTTISRKRCVLQLILKIARQADWDWIRGQTLPTCSPLSMGKACMLIEKQGTSSPFYVKIVFAST